MLLRLTRALPLPRYSSAMSTVTVSPAMAILDKLIEHVSNLPSTGLAATSSASASASASTTSSSPSAASSFLPSHTTDIAWRPIVPIGHTKYTWVGDDDTATAPAGVSASAAPTSSITTAAVPQPDTAAAASAALPVPHAAKPAKEKKAAAQPGNGQKKEEEKKTDQPDISRVDIRVGQIIRAWRHPEAEKLYVEEIDVGEDKPRQVVSGLVPYIPLEQFQSARLCVVCNLKPSALRGVTSYGMVLAASNADRSAVELIAPPAAARVGERLTLSTVDVLAYGVDAVIDPKKKGNVWDVIKGGLKTDAEGRATWEGGVWRTSAGECRAPTLKDAVIS